MSKENVSMNEKSNNQGHDDSSAPVMREERPVRQEIAAAVKRYLVSDLQVDSQMKVMDYGCGTGLIAVLLSEKAGSIAAVETSRKQLDILEQKIGDANIKNITAHQVDLTSEEWPAAEFNLIFSSMTLHHIGQPIQVLKGFYNALLPGGSVAVADLDSEDGSFHGDRTADVAHHGFDRDELKVLMEQAGFSQISHKTIHMITRRDMEGREKEYSMFLMSGIKEEKGDQP